MRGLGRILTILGRHFWQSSGIVVVVIIIVIIEIVALASYYSQIATLVGGLSLLLEILLMRLRQHFGEASSDAR